MGSFAEVARAWVVSLGAFFTSMFTSSAPDGSSNLAKVASIKIRLRNKVKLRDIAWTMDQLATMQAAGLPTFRAFGTAARGRAGTPLGEILADVQNQMLSGVSIGAAMRRHEKTFGPLICSLVEAGEQAGSLDQSLTRAARMTESSLQLRRKIRGALIYPMSVIVIASGLVAALLTFVVPRFSSVYAQVGSKLPALTLAIVKASHVAPWILGALVVGVLAVVCVWKVSKNDAALRLRIDQLRLRIPIVGPLLAKGAHARVTSTLAGLLGAGVPLLTAMDFAADAAANSVYAAALRDARAAVNDGQTLTGALAETGVFPDLMVQLAAVGEESGALSTLMDKFAAATEKEVNAAAALLASLIEPIVMAVIGGIVGVFIIGLYMPIINLSSQIH